MITSWFISFSWLISFEIVPYPWNVKCHVLLKIEKNSEKTDIESQLWLPTRFSDYSTNTFRSFADIKLIIGGKQI